MDPHPNFPSRPLEGGGRIGHKRQRDDEEGDVQGADEVEEEATLGSDVDDLKSEEESSSGEEDGVEEGDDKQDEE